jgi:imidazolonepropionase-like amidohydrolase
MADAVTGGQADKQESLGAGKRLESSGRRRFAGSLLIAAVSTLLCSCDARPQAPAPGPGPDAEERLVIENVWVMDPGSATSLPEQSIVVRGGRIEWVGPSRELRDVAGAMVDASGRFAIPGLIDLHQHAVGFVGHPEEWLAKGITSVRNPGADDLESARRARAMIDAGHSAGPRLFLGLLVDFDAAQTPDSVRTLIEKEHEKGIDLVKLYSRTPLDHARAAIAQAHQEGLPVTWHLSGTLSDAIELGTDGVEHLYVFRELMPEPAGEAPPTASDAFQLIYRRWASHLDPEAERAKALFGRLAERRIVWTPTLVLSEQIAMGRKEYSKGWTRKEVEAALAGFDAACMMVGAAHRAGVLIGAGTDTEDPGDFHRELELLVRCGLSPMSALEAATSTAAAALLRDQLLGAVRPGFAADLVLLDGDPAEDISNTRRVWRVVKDGRVLDPTALLAEIGRN